MTGYSGTTKARDFRSLDRSMAGRLNLPFVFRLTNSSSREDSDDVVLKDAGGGLNQSRLWLPSQWPKDRQVYGSSIV
jgi:hypothetical protein